MARELTQAIRDHLNSGEAIDPLMIVGISFYPGQEILYADRDLDATVKGQIIEFGELETITRLDGNGSSSSISFTLDDHEGHILWILKNVDVLYSKVRVYQHFYGTSFGNLILLFEGVLATPIEWDEGTRTVRLTAITKQSNYEVGFALDESTTPVFHETLLDKPWPMIFGSPRYSPVLDLQEIPTGILVNPIYMTDPSFPFRVQELSDQMDAVRAEQFKGHDYTEEDRIVNLLFIGLNLNFNPMPGQSWDNPRSALNHFTTSPLGSFPVPIHYAEIIHRIMLIVDEDHNNYVNWYNDQQFRLRTLKEERTFTIAQWNLQKSRETRANFIIGGYKFPPGRYLCKINEETFYITFPRNTQGLHEDSAASVTIDPVPTAFTYTPGQGIVGSRFIQAGAQVELLDDFPGGYHHVASITPGTVEGVYAYQTINGFKRLARVPDQYWTTRTENKGGYTITYIVTTRPLATVAYFENLSTQIAEDAIARIKNIPSTEVIKLQNKIEWENEIFVNFVSTVGPNTVDILIWLIHHYTTYTYDHATFSAVWTHVNPFPANFALLERPNVDALIEDIAYQSRCAVWIKNGKYYIKYLPATPVATEGITDGDIIFGSLKVKASDTNDLITKYIATWKADGLQEEATIVVKNNVERFGTLEDSYNFYIYDNYNTVLKSATFWLIRRSNIWKIVNVNCFLTKLAIETLDDVNLDLAQSFVTNDSNGIVCQVESAQYDSSSNSIQLELWTGIKFGSMDVYPFARPADSAINLQFPLPVDIFRGDLPLTPFSDTAPDIPKFNASQPDPPSKIELIQRHLYVTYVVGDKPSTKGDTYPSDHKTTVNYGFRQLSPKIVPNRAARPTDNYTYNPPPKPIALAPITNKPPSDLIGGAGGGGGGTGGGDGSGIPGRVVSIGADGTQWNVHIFPDGIGTTGITIQATELHGDPNLIAIDGEWVSVFKQTDINGFDLYYFFTQHQAVMPVKMTNNTEGAIFPYSSTGQGLTRDLKQIQIAEGYQVPVDTWAICCRMWNGTNFVYETQVPVWRFVETD